MNTNDHSLVLTDLTQFVFLVIKRLDRQRNDDFVNNVASQVGSEFGDRGDQVRFNVAVSDWSNPDVIDKSYESITKLRPFHHCFCARQSSSIGADDDHVAQVVTAKADDFQRLA